MRFLIRGLVFSLLFVSVQDVAQAQLLGRRWERRKAELRHEISTKLTAKVDRDLAREMDDVRQSNDQQLGLLRETLRNESESLCNQVEDELAVLRSKAQEVVKAEAERLERETKKQVASLRQAAAKQIADESKRLEKVVEIELVKAQDRASMEFESALAVLNKRQDGFAASADRRLNEELAKLPGMVNAQVELAAERIMPEVKTAIEVAVKESLPSPVPSDAPRDSGEEVVPSAALNSDEDQDLESDGEDSDADGVADLASRP